MNKTTKILLALAAVVIIAVGAVLIASIYKQPAEQHNTPENQTQNGNDDNTQPAQEPAEPTVTITYDGNGFALSASTIKAGETVKVVNSSSKELDFDSNPHPVHTDNPELNAGPIAAGESHSFVLTTKGSWGFHNHLNASQRGNLTVE
ncbi:MAG TPA: hypothetical protein VFZ58_02915 [Candidatus Saccharimonadales bacterium]